jgi:hypothetical protein
MWVYYGYHEGILIAEVSVFIKPQKKIFINYPNAQSSPFTDYIDYEGDPIESLKEFCKINLQWKRIRFETELKKQFIEVMKAIMERIDRHKKEILFYPDPHDSKLVLGTLHNYISSIIEKLERD